MAANQESSIDPFRPERRPIFLIIASTPRVGSSLLGDLLGQRGIGDPAEYFNPYTGIPVYAKEFGAKDYKTYWKRLKDSRTINGYLSVKAHFEHFQFFRGKAPILIDPAFRKTHFLKIRRKNKLRQAISYAISRHSGRWSSNQTQKRSPAELLDLPEKELYARIRGYMVNLYLRECLWDEFFLTFGLSAPTLYYEDLVSGGVTLGKEIGLNSTKELVPDNARLEAQHNEVNERIESVVGRWLDATSDCSDSSTYYSAIELARVFFKDI